MERERYLYLDVAKGIAIISVVLGHIILKYESNNILCTWLYSFHLPIFFFITGILFSLNDKEVEKNSKKFIIYKAKKLLYPYMTFSCISIIYLIVKGESLVSIVKIVINTVLLFGYGPIWFLPTLLIAEIIFYIIMKQPKKIKIFLMSVIIIITIMFSYILQMQFWQANIINELIYKFINLLVRALIADIFIIGGYYFQENKYKFFKKIIIYLIILLVNIYTSQLNGLIDIHYCKINNFILFIYTAFTTSIALLMILEQIVKKENILTFLGKNSLIIMSTHYTLPFIEIAIYICEQLLKIRHLFCIYIIETFIVMFLECLMIKLINKKLKFLLKLR